ncbi:MAG: Tfp pilus assembly protein FimT/FimU [Acidobacteriota bacterium]
MALAVVGLALLISLPGLAESVRRERLDSATRSLVRLLSAARWQALLQGTSMGLRLELLSDHDLRWRVFRDGDGDGMRRDDMNNGTDPAMGPPGLLSRLAPGVKADILPGYRVPRLPPQTGSLPRLQDPVKFGASNMATFSPLGGARSGSLYLSDGVRMNALVVNGTTGRLRIFRFDTSKNHWKEMH